MILKTRLIIRFVLYLVFATISINAIHSQTNTSRQPIRLLVDKFVTSNVNDSILYNTDISGFIKLSLLKYPNIKIVKNDSTKIDPTKINSGQKYYNELLNKVDCILSGNYNITGNTIVVNAGFYSKDKADPGIIYTGDIDRIDFFIDDLGRQISSRLYELNGMAEKKIAILYHLNKADLSNKNKKIYASELTREIIYSFHSVENVKAPVWLDESDYTDKTKEEIINKLKLDGYLDLRFNFKKDNLMGISPCFYYKNISAQTVDSIHIPNFPADYYPNIYYTDFLVNELGGFLNSFYNFDQGSDKSYQPASISWNDLFVNDDTNSAKGNFYKSNSFLYLFMDKNQNLRDSALIKIHYRLGINKFVENRLEEAAEEFNKVLVYDNTNYDAHCALAKLFLTTGDYEGALAHVASLPLTNEINILKGQAYYGLGKYEEAKENLEKVSSANKLDHYTASVYLGYVYVELKEPERALQIINDLYLNDSTNEDIRYYYSSLLATVGINEFASLNYSRAIKLLLDAQRIYDVNYTVDYLRLSYIHVKRFDDALVLIEQEIQTGGYDPYGIYLTHALDIREMFIKDTLLGKNELKQMGRQVINALDKHIRHNPDDPYGYYYKGNTLTRMGFGTEGLSQMETAFEKDTENVSIQLDLMELYLLNNKFEKCESFYNRVATEKLNSAISTITNRDMAIMNYLLISALAIQDKDYSKYKEELDKLFNDGTDINFWSYNSYRDWLETGKYDKTTKEFLRDLTRKMEEHDKSTI